jgi:hypothetical protein
MIQLGFFYFLLLTLLGAPRTDAATILIGARIIDGTGRYLPNRTLQSYYIWRTR